MSAGVEAPLVRQFDLLATTPGGVARLRELILTLAVQGKLVPQEAGDEPASVCLARISNSRANDRLTAKSERARLATALADDERPFSLPQGWAWACLAEFAQSRLGKMLDKAKNTGKLYPYLRNTNVQWGRIDLDDVKLIRLDIHELNEYRLQIGDLLVCEGGEPGRCAIWSDQTREMYFQKALHRIRPEGGISPKFLAICLEADARSGRLAQQFTGATIKHFAGQELEKYTVALPPVSEQSRIVTRVEELMRLCDALEQQRQLETAQHAQLLNTLLGTLTDCTSPDELAANWQRVSDHFDLLLDRPEAVDALEQTILQLAVRGLLVPQDPADEPASVLLQRIRAEKDRLISAGKIKRDKLLPPIVEQEIPFQLPAKWEWARVGSVGITATGGTPATSKPEYFGDAIPFIGPGQITQNGDILPADKYISELGKSETEVANHGDILMVCIGGSIGKCATANTPTAFNQQINSFRSIIGSSSYILCTMSTEYFRNAVLSAATGSATPIISRGKWDILLMPIPPAPEQTRIVARVAQLRDLCITLRQRLAARQTTQRHLAEALVEV